MAEDFKTIKGNLLKSVFSAVASASDSGGESRSSTQTIRDVISGLSSIAGKGKDEIVQMISREIGQAIAGVVKEPLRQILEERKLKVTLELVDKDPETATEPTTKTTKKSGSTKKSSRKASES